MKRLFLDTEFNGFGGQLISIAIVSEDGDEWYQTVKVDAVAVEPWVAVNVMPQLNACGERVPVGYAALPTMIEGFLAKQGHFEVIADWPADFEHLCRLLSEIGRKNGFIRTIECTMKLINVPGQLKPEVPHNALSDARALRDWWVSQQPFAHRPDAPVENQYDKACS